MRFDFWAFMSRKDIFILNLFAFFIKVKQLFSFNKVAILKSNYEIINSNSFKKELFIILNGPSLKKQDLSSLKGKDLMFVNRGFKHPLFNILKPKFHVIVDPKLLTGEWPIYWLNEILEKSPSTILVFPFNWYNKTPIKDFRNKNKDVSIFWITMINPFSCMGVSGECFKTSIKLGYKNIYFTGFDATGFAYGVLKSESSHFYGANDENLLKTSKEFVRDAYMYGRQLHDLTRFASNAKKKNVSIYNLTDGGVLDMFERTTFDKFK